MPEPTIRDARPGDLAAVVAIYNESVPGRLATADLEPVDVEQRRAWFVHHSPERRPLWVAEDPQCGDVVGWLGFSDFYGRPAYAATAEVSVYVAGPSQGAGVGSALLARAIERAPALGLSTLLGFVFAHNAPSLALFASKGFERWGALPRVADLDGVRRDLVILGREL